MSALVEARLAALWPRAHQRLHLRNGLPPYLSGFAAMVASRADRSLWRAAIGRSGRLLALLISLFSVFGLHTSVHTKALDLEWEGLRQSLEATSGEASSWKRALAHWLLAEADAIDDPAASAANRLAWISKIARLSGSIARHRQALAAFLISNEQRAPVASDVLEKALADYRKSADEFSRSRSGVDQWLPLQLTPGDPEAASSPTASMPTFEMVADQHLSDGDRDLLYRLIIDSAMARVWQTAAGDRASERGYLQHLAGRSSDSRATSFIAWRGIDQANWKQRIAQTLQPFVRPFAVLSVMTSHYLYTHSFSIIGYLVARNIAQTLVDQAAASGEDRLRWSSDVDRLTAALMDRSGLPLMGIDWLLSIADLRAQHVETAIPYGALRHDISAKDASTLWSCALWRFFDASRQRLPKN